MLEVYRCLIFHVKINWVASYFLMFLNFMVIVKLCKYQIQVICLQNRVCSCAISVKNSEEFNSKVIQKHVYFWFTTCP
jgi:hypothetical protein